MKLNNYEIKRVIKVVLLVFAFLIGFFSLWYTNNLVEKLEDQERQKIHTWANATKLIASPNFKGDVNFLFEIIEENSTIPVILTDGNGAFVNSRNIDTSKINIQIEYKGVIARMSKDNEPIKVEYLEGQNLVVFYENSVLLNQLKVYPYFQLGVIGLFLAVS